jgi:hypothetical protein
MIKFLTNVPVLDPLTSRLQGVRNLTYEQYSDRPAVGICLSHSHLLLPTENLLLDFLNYRSLEVRRAVIIAAAMLHISSLCSCSRDGKQAEWYSRRLFLLMDYE